MNELKDVNILYLCKTMDYGGTEKVVLMLCEEFKNKFKKIIVCSSGGAYLENLQSLDIKHYKIIDFDNKSISGLIRNFFALLNIVKLEKINVIHSQHRFGTVLANIISKFYNVRVIHTAHNVFYDKKFFMKLLKKTSIIAVGNNVKNNLIKYYKFNSSNVTTIYNGIEATNEEVKLINDIKVLKDRGNFIVANIGRICDQKGMEFFVDSMKHLKDKNITNIKYIIVGDGPNKLKIESIIEEYNLKNDIILLGFRKDIFNIINQVDLVVLSSLWEGLPLTPIEVFSQGKTIIATRVDGTPEIVKNYENGILVEPKNSLEIMEKVLELSRNSELRRSLEVNALNTYNKYFEKDSMIKNYYDYYRKIINS